MKDYTITELMAKTHLNGKNMALKVGCSMSLISKLKNGATELTQETKNKFFDVFGVYIINDVPKWKKMYLEQLEINNNLRNLIETLNIQNKELNSIIDKIKRVVL